MDRLIVAATIIAFGIALAGLLIGGRYEISNTTGNSVQRLDRFTGEVKWCLGGSGCGWSLDKPAAGQ